MEVESKRITIPIDGKRGTYLLEEWRIGIHGRNSKRFFLRFKNHFLIYKKKEQFEQNPLYGLGTQLRIYWNISDPINN